MTDQTTNPWQIDVFALCKEQATIKGELPIALLTRLAADLTRHDGVLNYQLSGTTDDKKRALLRIQVNGSLMMRCQRCLEDMQHAVDVDYTVQLVHSEQELDSEEDELNAVAEGRADIEKIVGSKTFDTLNLLEDEIILSLPIVTTHKNCEKTLPMSAGEKTSPFDALRALKAD